MTEDSADVFGTMRQKAGEIVDTIDLRSRIDRFPEAYLGDYDGEIDYIDYEWQTRRYPVNAEVEEFDDGRFAVTAGRLDEITDPLIDRDDREGRELRARYIHAAVDGRNVMSGEETSIPIPSDCDGVKQIMAALEEDKQTIEEILIKELEAEIDEAVYDLFELTDKEREIIEEYLEIF